MDRTVRAILVLMLCYLALGVYAFGIFLQRPLFPGEPLTVQAAIEPFAYIVSMIVGNLAILHAVLARDRRGGAPLNEGKLRRGAIALSLLISFGAGLHTAGTLVEEAFFSQNVSTVHPGDFTFEVAFWLEEYLSHYLIMVAYVPLLFLLVQAELNREPTSLAQHEKVIVAGCGCVFGGFLAIASLEAGAVDLLIAPLNVFLMLRFRQLRQSQRSPFLGFPFSVFWLAGSFVMVILTLAFRITYGLRIQPTDLGFGVAG